jgi:DNA modification methylase
MGQDTGAPNRAWLDLRQGAAIEVLRAMPEQSVNCCVTSPPYWGLRDYGTALWEGGNPVCDHQHTTEHQRQGVTSQRVGRANVEAQRNENFRTTCPRCGASRVDRQLGLEATFTLYIERMVEVFQEVRRVLRDDGTLWLNLGDCYHSGDRGGYQPSRVKAEDSLQRGNLASDFTGAPNRLPQKGLKDKDLVGMPWRVALALQADGWWLRSDIVWSKPNPMPESVTDRPTKAHEYLFLLAKATRYYYDAEAIREAWTSGRDDMRENGVRTGLAYLQQAEVSSNDTKAIPKRVKMPDGWDTGAGGHGSFHRNGREKGKTKAVTSPRHDGNAWNENNGRGFIPTGAGRNKRSVWEIATQPYPEAHFATFPEALVQPCILAGCPEGGVVLDPFLGSGTTALVANRLGRRALGIELNPAYLELARARCAQVTVWETA